MMQRIRFAKITAVAMVIVCCAIFASSPVLSQRAPSASADWDVRLEALRPQEPAKYLELAEEVADAAIKPDERALARHLFALAGALEPERLGRSACLALADLEENPQSRKRLLALAALLPGIAGANVIESKAASRGADDWSQAAAIAVGEALSYYRRGDGDRALTALKQPGADALLQQFGNMLPGGYQRFVEDCKLYNRQQPPTLSSADIIRMLRFESSILAGRDRAWSSELLLSAGEPLIEIDPTRLEESLNVDVTRPFHRGGRWVER